MREKLIGIGLVILCVLAGAGYIAGLYFGLGSILAIVLASAAFFALLALIGWIGWTIATTPAPKGIEELSKELEKEEASQEEKKHQ